MTLEFQRQLPHGKLFRLLFKAVPIAICKTRKWTISDDKSHNGAGTPHQSPPRWRMGIRQHGSVFASLFEYILKSACTCTKRAIRKNPLPVIVLILYPVVLIIAPKTMESPAALENYKWFRKMATCTPLIGGRKRQLQFWAAKDTQAEGAPTSHLQFI